MGKFATSTSWGYPTTEYPAPLLPLDVDLLIGICQNQGRSGKEKQIIDYLEALFNGLDVYLEFDDKHNMYVTKGVADVYPCMVAHLDTVHDYQSGYGVAVSEDGDVLYAYSEGVNNPNFSKLSPPVKQAGVGGDDRCGIAIAIQLLQAFPAFKVAFFREEEIGGANGSGSAYMPFFDDVSLVLQCDRYGSSDWVQTAASTQVASDEFITAIKPLLTYHQYKPIQSGGFTDVVNLKKRKLGVCAANMSCGYYSPHSSSETIHLPTMENTLNLCYSVFQLLGHEKQVHEYVPYVYKASYSSGTSNYGNNYGNNNFRSQTSFNHYDTGWKQRQVALTDEHGVERRVWKYVKEDKEGNVLAGPCMWTECEAAEKAYQAKVSEAKRKQEEKEQRDLKATIKQWVDKDGTWVLDKRQPKGKIWVKELYDEGSGEYFEVAYAAKLLDIPYEEGQFRNDFGKDLLDGTLTVKQVYELLVEMEEERQALEHLETLEEEKQQKKQLRLGFSAGERSYQDDDDDYQEYNHSPVGSAMLTCPHCKSVEERHVSTSKGLEYFWCQDCHQFSDEQPDGTFAKEVATSPLSYGPNMQVLKD